MCLCYKNRIRKQTMKFILAVATLFACAKTHNGYSTKQPSVTNTLAEIPSEINGNLLQNGNFGQGFTQSAQGWNIVNTLPGWEVNQVERGRGYIYNTRWGNKLVVELDGNQNNCLRQKVDLQAGEYTLELDYAARTGFVGSSAMRIAWNGETIKRIDGVDEEIHHLKISLIAKAGNNVLEIFGEGTSDCLGMTISNARLTVGGFFDQKVSDNRSFVQNNRANIPSGDFKWRVSSKNFLSNGDFEKDTVGKGRNWVTSLSGWNVKKVRRGAGNLWNSRWGNKCVIELDGQSNDPLKQVLSLSSGQYRFELNYAIADGITNNPSFSVWINDEKISQTDGADNDIHTLAFNFAVKTDGEFAFEIRGEGQGPAGLTFGQISLFSIKTKSQFESNQACFNGDQ